MSEQQTDQPQEAPKTKARYSLDDAGVLHRVINGDATSIAIYKDGVVTILEGMTEFQPNAVLVLKRMGHKIERVEHEPAREAPAPVVEPTEEPPTEPHLGERTPVWLAWCKANQPERYAAVCKRLKISDQPET